MFIETLLPPIDYIITCGDVCTFILDVVMIITFIIIVCRNSVKFPEERVGI